MRHTKKMIMISEEEYLALLAMLKPDKLAYEKAEVEREMEKSLRGPKNADIKAKKYDWLYKQKRNLAEKIESKPQRVIIENVAQMPAIPPYMGIQPRKKEELYSPELYSPEQESEPKPGIPFEEPVEIEDIKNTGKVKIHKKAKRVSSKASISEGIYPYIDSEYYNELYSLVNDNKDAFKIDDAKRVTTATNRAIDGSNFEKVLKYMTDKKAMNATVPFGHNELFNRLKKDPRFVELYHKSYQKGKGKKLLNIKGKKLAPIRKFKPTIWVRI